jgi:hypothetical protein
MDKLQIFPRVRELKTTYIKQNIMIGKTGGKWKLQILI